MANGKGRTKLSIKQRQTEELKFGAALEPAQVGMSRNSVRSDQGVCLGTLSLIVVVSRSPLNSVSAIVGSQKSRREVRAPCLVVIGPWPSTRFFVGSSEESMCWRTSRA